VGRPGLEPCAPYAIPRGYGRSGGVREESGPLLVGAAEEIAAGENGRNRVALDRRRRFATRAAHCAQQGCMEIQSFEGSCRFVSALAWRPGAPRRIPDRPGAQLARSRDPAKRLSAAGHSGTLLPTSRRSHVRTASSSTSGPRRAGPRNPWRSRYGHRPARPGYFLGGAGFAPDAAGVTGSTRNATDSV